MKDAVIEPKAGGRWFEVGEDGNRCEWGEVLAWEPPTRLLLAWRIGTDWQYLPDLLTEVEVRFTPIDDRTTRVELEHRLLENMGEAAEAARVTFESEHGWGAILAGYAKAASSKAARAEAGL
jgi:uncharacterized protein YndB with AHSA1/START domain